MVYVALSLFIADRIVFIFTGLAVNSVMIRLKAKELSSDPEFKASPGWYTKWKRRHAISMRSKTTLPQRLPADMEDKVVECHRFVLRARQRCGYESSQILNMDETPMRFELPATRTLEFTGNRNHVGFGYKLVRCRSTRRSCFSSYCFFFFTNLFAVAAFIEVVFLSICSSLNFC